MNQNQFDSRPDASSRLRSLTIRSVSAIAIAAAATVLLGACSSTANESAQAFDTAAASAVAEQGSFAAADIAAAETTVPAATEATSAERGEPNQRPASQAVRREVVYTAVAEVEVTNAAAEATRIRREVIAAGGWVLSDERFETQVSMVLKVPPKSFDATLTNLSKAGKVRSQRVSAADVTADMVDLEARLKSAQISRDRLRALLNAAVKIDDVIALEAELGQRESTVEQMTGQLNVLRSQVGFATVNLTLFQRSVATIDDSTPTPAEGFNRGWVALKEALRTVAVGLATIAVWLPFAIVGLLFVRFGIRRRRSRNIRLGRPVRPAWTPPTDSILKSEENIHPE